MYLFDTPILSLGKYNRKMLHRYSILESDWSVRITIPTIKVYMVIHFRQKKNKNKSSFIFSDITELMIVLKFVITLMIKIRNNITYKNMAVKMFTMNVIKTFWLTDKICQ